MEYKLVFLAKLHVEERITCIHLCTNTIVNLFVGTTCRRVLMSELADTPEGQEWTETESGGRMGIDEGITNQNAILVVLEYHFFF